MIKNINGKKGFLVIDPAIQKPECEAYNSILRFFGDLAANPAFPLSCVQFSLPALTETPFANTIAQMNIAGIICLGSRANVTDNLPWVNELSRQLRSLIVDKAIPFLGICFAHQLSAHMFGCKVGFLKTKELYPGGKFYSFRKSQLTHPKFAMLWANLNAQDHFSGNERDAEFRFAMRLTKNWNSEDWNHFLSGTAQTPLEMRLSRFFELCIPNAYTAHARHEQEVLEVLSQDLLVASTSEFCHVDALVHSTLPFFTLQSHPETWHEDQDGWRLLRNFIYFAAVRDLPIP